MDSPETWRWIWVGTAFLFLVAEMAMPGSFFLLPFGIGALVAATLGFADVDLVWQWLAFVLVSVGSFAALRPVARRLDASDPVEGIGAKRLIGESAEVIDAIEAGDIGRVRVDREEWRAEAVDGVALPAGTRVQVVDVVGTRVVVHPAEALTESDEHIPD